MALAYALHYIEAHDLARITNYGEFLEKYSPEHEVEIFEDTSWSCAHGVERWKADCGCSTGAHPGWNQAWRAPLREALDGLRVDANRVFETEGSRLFRDPWAARNTSTWSWIAPRPRERPFSRPMQPLLHIKTQSRLV
jgi:alpha-amylase/alpha-mannosidase (GH57 family)